MRKIVFVFMGGPSVEHPVSLVSGTGIVRALDPHKYDIHPVLISQDDIGLGGASRSRHINARTLT